MKLFIAPLWAILALFMCLNTIAQDIIYTNSGEINSQKTALDSIAVENLTNQTHIGFGDLPERDDYRINLTRNEYWGSTSVNDILNQSGLQIIKNLPGNFPFISLCDYKKWESPAIKAYHVFATPTM